MARHLPRLNAKQIIAILERHGFAFSRQSGSHKIFRNLEGRRVTIPFHGATILHPKVLKSIVIDAGLNMKELQ